MEKYKKIPDNQIIFYQSSDGFVHVDVMYVHENVCLSQKGIAELFGVDISTINEHLKNIYRQKELQESVTIGKFPIVQKEGEREIKRNIAFYCLEAIITVGYRVNSERAREFRGWATRILKEYIYKGYIVDNARMKYGSRFSTRYFDELYEEIRDIRTSERMIYQKITDIFATAVDYSSTAKELALKEYKKYKKVQDKNYISDFDKQVQEILKNKNNQDNEKNK